MGYFRKERIAELCRGKTVLHLGFIEHRDLYEEKIRTDDWLHSDIAVVAARLVGVDFLSAEIEHLRKVYGYECYTGDVMDLTQVPLEGTFDVVVCGELIEHIENPGLMLDGIKRLMHPGSLLVITTPNPWSSLRMALIKKGLTEETWLNPEHVAWYSYQTLRQLLTRKHFREVEYSYYHEEKQVDLFRNLRGPLKSLRLLYRRYKLYATPERLLDGLLFIAALEESDEASKNTDPAES